MVVAGYVEKEEVNFYNSMLIISEEGIILKNYRKAKVNYFEWFIFTPGNGYDFADIPIKRLNRIVRFGLGIGMDIWNSSADDFEEMDYAKFQKDNGS